MGVRRIERCLAGRKVKRVNSLNIFWAHSYPRVFANHTHCDPPHLVAMSCGSIGLRLKDRFYALAHQSRRQQVTCCQQSRQKPQEPWAKTRAQIHASQ